jgi:hypothetical protein
MLGKIFDPFVKASPVSVMAQGLMERILHPERLDACFDGLESAQYTRELLFSSVCNRMSQVVCGSQRSVHAAIKPEYSSGSAELAPGFLRTLDGRRGVDVLPPLVVLKQRHCRPNRYKHP